MALKFLEMREQDYLRLRDEAVQKQRWSQVSGFDGIATGLQIAQGVLRQEFKTKGRKRG